FGLAPAGYSYTRQNGIFYQHGGTVNVSSLHTGSLSPGNAYTIYSGILNAGGIQVGSIDPSHFYQYGGQVNAGSLGVGGSFSGSRYYLNNGILNVTNTIRVGGNQGDNNFFQEAGTNRVSYLVIGPSDYGAATYVLNGGLLCTGDVLIPPAGREGYLDQNGGVHIVTNTLTVIGNFERYSRADSAYRLNSGVLSAGQLDLAGGSLSLRDATIANFGLLQVRGGTYDADAAGSIFIPGGKLACANLIHEGSGGAHISQTGGEFIVTNLFSFGGVGGFYRLSSLQYNFTGGTLMASNIELAADMMIGSSTNTGRITNPGYFKMAGKLTVGDATEQLGRFILTSNSIINLGDGRAKLSFANSSAEVWNSGTILTITNWNGSPNGGGADQLKFGSKSSGLSSGQVSQIRFIDPSGASLARILTTGEVVPLERPNLSRVQVGNNLVLSWTGNLSLQTATNVTGPYLDLPDATSPYTNDMTASPERYFRLRQ
ncbi:MAG: hypothetical protein M3Y82_13230, partial [Verrucomicrobiota bacterium]|nr:hypothetical protein [Verrucomicrobiota bacterium]